MSQPKLFKYRHFEPEIILLCLRWYLRYSLSYRDLEEMMAERGLSVDHTTIYRWVQHYAPILEKRCRAKLKPTNNSWRVDETYVKVKGQWMYLYRAVDSAGETVEFMLSPTRDATGSQAFLPQRLYVPGTPSLRVSSTWTRTLPTPKPWASSRRRALYHPSCELRPVKYLNNLIEQDHRFIKRRVNPGMGFWSFDTAWRTLQGTRQ